MRVDKIRGDEIPDNMILEECEMNLDTCNKIKQIFLYWDDYIDTKGDNNYID